MNFVSKLDIFIMIPTENSTAILKRENRLLMKRETLGEPTYFLHANCQSIDKIQFKNFYLTIFMALNTNIMNKTIKTFTLTNKILLIFKKHTCLKTSEMDNDSKTKCNQGKQS